MKMQVPLGKPQPWVIPVTFVCLVLGGLIAFLMRSIAAANENVPPDTMTREQLIYRFSSIMKDNEALLGENEDLRQKKDELINVMTSEQELKGALQKEINQLRIYASSSPIEGPGIVITVDDSDTMKTNPIDVNVNALLTHDVDLLQVVNELRSAGAEGIAVNDQRVGGTSAIRCVGPVIQVNNRPISAPFVVKAVGKPDTLYGAVNLPMGILDQLKQLGIHITVAKRTTIHLPAVTVLPPLEVGKVVSEEKNDNDGK